MSPNHHPPNDQHQPPGPTETNLITEAERLRTHLQEALAHVNRLITALRHERRRHRAVEAAVASLRRLNRLAR
jgi:hypothetical protein